jgi:hypothetical protein
MTLKREHGDAAIKIICAAIPAIAVFFAIPNQTAAIVVSVVSAVGVFLGFRQLSKITVPEAFALGYFSSFLEPNAYAADHNGIAHYQDKTGQSIDQPLKGVIVRFLIVLPEELNMGGKATPVSLSEIQKYVEQVCISGNLEVEPPNPKPFGIYLETSNPNELIVVDVPNNLQTLNIFSLREFGGAPDCESRAKKVLAEYVNELKKMIREQQVRLKGRVTTLQASEFIAGKRA